MLAVSVLADRIRAIPSVRSLVSDRVRTLASLRTLVAFSFHEKMEGTVVHEGERFDRPFRFEFDVRAPNVLGFVTTTVGAMEGTVRIDGLAKDVPATGHIELSPVHRNTMRYVFEFTADDGKKYRFDGSKKTTVRRHLVGWTTLPGKVYDADGDVWGEAVLRFSLRRDLRDLLRSFRFGPHALAGA
jgi:hypothetical protein